MKQQSRDHHPGYITWEVYEQNLQVLLGNRTNLERSGPARGVAALLQGLFLCGKCGRRMSVRYTGNGGISPVYECKGRREHGRRATCTAVPTPSIDRAIGDQLLKTNQLGISEHHYHSPENIVDIVQLFLKNSGKI